MLHFNTLSWHYRLVMYVFGNNFFTENDTVDMTEYRKSAKIVWTRKPKVINFCPYCRGVLWSVLSLPFVYVWRIFFPHDPTKELTHAQTMRRMKIRGILIRSIGGGIQFPFAVGNYLNGNYEGAIVNLAFGVGIIATFMFLPGNKRVHKFLRIPINKRISKILVTPFKYLWMLIDPIIAHIVKYFEEKDKNKTKNPNIIITYLHSKHSEICPPVCFIEKVDQENFR